MLQEVDDLIANLVAIRSALDGMGTVDVGDLKPRTTSGVFVSAPGRI
jgi:hypothetical protein